MDKFIIRFYSTFQFACPALALMLLTYWLGYHILHGSLDLFVGTLFFIIEGILIRLTRLAYREMKEDYRNSR